MRIGLPIVGLWFLAACGRASERPTERPTEQLPAPPADALRRESQPPPPAGFTVQLTDPCTGPAWQACVPGAESVAIENSEGRIRREASALLIELASREPLAFRDDTTEGDGFIRYRYLGQLPGLPIDVLDLQYYEGGQYLAIHRAAGDTALLDAIPLIAPGLARLVTASADFDVGYYPNRLTIYRITPDGLETEWRLETGDYQAGTGWAAIEPVWSDSTSVEFQVVRPGGDEGAVRAGEARLVLGPTGWVLIGAPDA